MTRNQSFVVFVRSLDMRNRTVGRRNRLGVHRMVPNEHNAAPQQVVNAQT